MNKDKKFYTLPKRLTIFALVLVSVFFFKNKLNHYTSMQSLKESATSLWLKNITQTKWQQKLIGSSIQKHLILTTLNKSYKFSRSDKALLFKKIPLTPAIVEIHFIADISYFVDLEKEFYLKKVGDKILIKAPTLEFMRPNIDLRSLKFKVVQNGLLVDEKEVLSKLQANLPLLLHDDAIENLKTVREKARTELLEFLQNWYLKESTEIPQLELIFNDEDEEKI